MNIWIKRSLGTVAVTGGLVLAAAASAQADDASATSTDGSSSSESSFSSPITIGGIDVGTTSDSTSSRSTETTVTDGERSASESQESSQSSRSANGLSTGPISVDPQALLEQESRTSTDAVGTRGGDTGTSESSSESKTSGSASAPISIGGLTVTSDEERSSADRSAREATDGDRSTSELSERSEDSSSSTSFGVGALELDPRAAFANREARADSRLGGSDGISDSSRESESSSAASLPISFEGFAFTRDEERAADARQRSEARDGDRAVVSDVATSDRRASSTDFAGGGFSLAPAFSQERSDRSEASRLGGSTGLSESSSESASSTRGSLPISFEGFDLAQRTATDQGARSERAAIDGDRSFRELFEQRSTSVRESDVSSDGFRANPAFALDSERSDLTSRVGDLVRGESASRSSGDLSGPFSGGGFDVDTRSSDAFASLFATEARDGNRSVERVDTEQSERSDAQDFGFDGFSGDPRASFDTARQQLTDLFRR